MVDARQVVGKCFILLYMLHFTFVLKGLFLLKFVFVCRYECMPHACRYCLTPENSVSFPGAEVTGG